MLPFRGICHWRPLNCSSTRLPVCPCPHVCLQDQVHGCPYRTFNQQSLRSALGRLQVSPAKIEEAVGKAAAGHYQLACAAAWEGKHGCSCDSGINHPNQVGWRRVVAWVGRCWSLLRRLCMCV